MPVPKFSLTFRPDIPTRQAVATIALCERACQAGYDAARAGATEPPAFTLTITDDTPTDAIEGLRGAVAEAWQIGWAAGRADA